ncbi:MAG: UDP-N-acetylmuramoyl-tripeptide--D-alanyl-D-alanine ligase [Bacteroidales bacterium]|nr:UDP-N-acetylmuramoyl-tripeptide--D-alanyl-D-alanine ligase [Bacteroidales bacterium]
MQTHSLEQIYELFLQSKGISTDSRSIKPQTIFFCLKGENFNANKFAVEAVKSGALAAIADEQPEENLPEIILVDNVLETLQQLANHHRRQFSIPVLGITGSNGKTTTKELIHAVLQTKFKTHATSGNYNNHIGVPLTLLSIPADAEIAIIEMGANHQGEIGQLSAIAEPDFGLITNIGKAHLEGFGGFQGVIKTKSELYHWIRNHGKAIFINGDDSLLLSLSDSLHKISYGQNIDNQYQGKLLPTDSFLEISITNRTIKTKLLGEYNFYNAMAAYAIGSYFGVEIDQIQHALESYIPENKRSQLIRSGKNQIYLDAYNANPTSMKAALESFVKSEKNPKAVILGDMLELGLESYDEHLQIIKMLSVLPLEKVILVGPEFYKSKNEFTDFLFFTNQTEAGKYLNENSLENYYILIKGSRGIALENLLPNL